MNQETSPSLSVISARQLLPKLRALQRNTIGFLLETTRQHGDLVLFDLGKQRAVLVNDANLVKQILQDRHPHYDKNTIQYNMLATVTGRGLLTADGEDWFKHRRMQQPAFVRPRLETSLVPHIVPAAQRMLDRWQIAAQRGELLDVDREMMDVALEVVGQALFSLDLSRDARRLTSAVLVCLDHIIHLARNPHLSLLPDWLPQPGRQKFKHALKELNQSVEEIIRQRRAAGGPPPDDLVTMLLNARDPESGEGLSDAQIRDELITILIAGHETVASALTWTWLLLAQNPDAFQRLRAEVHSVLPDRDPNAEDLQCLPYTAAIFDEALRLYPPAWLITRRVVEADSYYDVRVDPGTLVILSPYALQRHPRYWPDPHTFRPERFLPDTTKTYPRYAYIPFGGGPRLCIGNHFAKMEAAIIIAMVARRFRLERADSAEVFPESLVTLRPRGGLPMRPIPLSEEAN